MALICDSATGKNRVELARLARENNLTVIAITATKMPLVYQAMLAMTHDVPQDAECPAYPVGYHQCTGNWIYTATWRKIHK